VKGAVWPAARPAIVAALLCLMPATGRPADSRTLQLRAEDGVTLSATWYDARRAGAPAVILLHMQTRSRADWDAVGHGLADAGIHALALDFRGHGASGRAPSGAAGQADLERLVLDVRAARTLLVDASGPIGASGVGIAGASIGANVAVLAAAGDAAIRSLVLLSPGLDYRSLRTADPMRQYGDRPALIVASGEDAYALRSARELGRLGGGVREVRTLEGAGHGTVMLDRDASLAAALVDWFQRTLL
jgi:pimeloyl-ACP methyl ester carboxylesterase